MVINKYYYVWDDAYSGFMIGKCLGSIKISGQYHRSEAVLINTFNDENKFSTNGWCFKDNKRYYREATSYEIEWLDRCIMAHRFIEKPKQNVYELW